MSEPDTTSNLGDETPLAKPVLKKSSVMDNLDPRVVDLLRWRCPKKSGVVFGVVLVVLLALTCYSSLRVVSELLLLVLGLGLSYRIYKHVLQSIKKEDLSNPFEQYLQKDISLTGENTQRVVDLILREVNCTVSYLRRVVLVESIVQSLKFGAVLWLLTYVGAWFNGLTLFIIGFVLMFTLPKIYDMYPEPIDNAYGLVTHHVGSTYHMISSKIPFIGKKDKNQ